jgi:starch synthase
VRAQILTREWPPDVYGGAGVHVEHLVPELRKLIDVEVQCFGAPRADALAHDVPVELAGANAALQTLGVDLQMAAVVDGADGVDIAHSHTWYANLAGHLASLLHGIPHVITAHSLEPRRPWKAEQLGGGYAISSWVERSAYAEAHAIIAVSAGMREDVLACYPFVDPERVHVVHNGITVASYDEPETAVDIASLGVDPTRPFALFVGRITRQKGIAHFCRAAQAFNPEIQIVICASGPDEPAIGEETERAIEHLQQQRQAGVVWIDRMLDRPTIAGLFRAAGVFVCPSVYEPLGIVNLEAMASETAVVASDVGGIPEVVVDGVTGYLVHYDEHDTPAFEAGLASRVNEVMSNPALAAAMGTAGRLRAEQQFSWDAVAARTVEVYQAAQQIHAAS